MSEGMKTIQKISSLKDLQERSPHGEYLRQLLNFYVPLALKLPSLRDDPSFMQEQIKATSAHGITDVVTAADAYMQVQIKQKVELLGNNWQFWGEEGEYNQITKLDKTKAHTVIVDPIEGTNNFKRKLDDQWGSVIALVDNKTEEPVIGVVAHPTQRRFYIATKGDGAYVIEYDTQGELKSFSPMQHEPESGHEQFTYNNSPHFSTQLTERVQRFFSQGKVIKTDELSRSSVVIDGNIFEDPESGALEAVRYRGTIYFKTSNEMAAVFVILNELRGKVTDGEGKPWRLGINTLIAARDTKDYDYLKSLYDQTAT